MIIVLAWTTVEQELAEKTWRHDLGERPKMREVIVPHAAVWVNAGTQQDVAKAEARARTSQFAPGTRVFAYPSTEEDPLGSARREILQPKAKAKRAHKHGLKCIDNAGTIICTKS